MNSVNCIAVCLVLVTGAFGTGFVSTDISVPSDFPNLTMNTSGSPYSGNYFLASLTTADATNSSYLIIANNNAEPLFYWHWHRGIYCVEIQPEGQLTFGTRLEDNIVSWLVMDTTYAIQDTFRIVGYPTDIHDFSMMSNGNAMLIGYDARYIDMSQIVSGGDPNALVKGLLIQEQDPDHNVVFEWSSFDYFDITEAGNHVDLLAAVIDYVHCNSISEDTDGNILLSCLAMRQCVKIDRYTGDVLWRFGGFGADTSHFTFVGDPLGGFSGHHDFQSSGGNSYTVFDNGKFHNPQVSRGLEYELDTNDMTATLLWSYEVPGLYGSHLGSVQKLPNGSFVIGWGDVTGTTPYPDVSEVLENGTEEHSFRFADPVVESYRAYKYSWEGQALIPYLIAEKDIANSSTILTYNVFGTRQFDQYRIWQGTSPLNLTPLLLTPDRQATVWELPAGWNYFAVSAIDPDQIETGLSNIDSVFVDWTGISLDQGTALPSLCIYPNPASGVVNVPAADSDLTSFHCEFFDIAGRIVLTSDEPGEISVSGLSPGLYTVRVTGTTGEFTGNLIILR